VRGAARSLRASRYSGGTKASRGTGYLSACLSLLGCSTHSIDIHAGLVDLAQANLRALPSARVQFQIRDAFDAAPLGEYDAVAVTGSLPIYDPRFEKSLRVGGR